MKKSLAKRWACHHCALIIQNATSEGWPFNYLIGDKKKGWTEKDEEKIGEAIEEIITELLRRGLREDDPE